MSHLMETLFLTLGSKLSEAEAQAVNAGRETLRTAEQRLTHQEFDQLWDAIVAIERASELDSFTLGFRLGVQLTLEGLRPVRPNQPT